MTFYIIVGLFVIYFVIAYRQDRGADERLIGELNEILKDLP